MNQKPARSEGYLDVEKHMRLAVIITFLLLLPSCARNRSTRVNATRALTTEESHIVEVARRAAQERGSDVSRLEFQIPSRSSEGGWSVVAWSLPKTPGGFGIIHIDEHDKVTRWDAGR